MIRHRPYGSGHPYSVDTEQRWPIDPIAGEPLTLGVRTSADVTAVSCEFVRDGVSSVVELVPTQRKSRGQTVDGGHLASAQARLARASGGWQTVIDDLTAGESCRYRFTAHGSATQSSRWFEVRVSAWHSADDAL